MLVVDANVLFACFNEKSFTRKLLEIVGMHVELVSPKLIIDEILEHKEEIKSKFSLSEEQFNTVLSFLRRFVKVIPPEEFREFIPHALNVSPDKEDVEYFALALKFSCPIWSNDKRLKQQDKVLVLSTEEIAKLFAE